MNNLLEFQLGNGDSLFLDPSIILEVAGGPAGTIVTVDRKDGHGEYVTYHIPVPINQFRNILRSRMPK